MEAQNYFLENQKSIAGTGFENIKFHVPYPDIPPMDKGDKSMEGVEPPTVPINIWILCKRALDGNKLVTSIERQLRGAYYFCTPEERVPKMMEYIDSLDCIIRTQLGYKEYYEIADGNLITRQFCKKEYTTVENCWKRKPKLDYLALNDIKRGKDKDGETKRNSSKAGAKKSAQKESNQKDNMEDMEQEE
eukprot:14670527-Ditylum_brightwellii.AAC.1